jgi:hypothetical protein
VGEAASSTTAGRMGGGWRGPDLDLDLDHLGETR